MVVKNNRFGGTDFVTPSDRIKPTDLNNTFDAIADVTDINVSNIATNVSNIATNVSNIATNASNIATNASNITGLQNDLNWESNFVPYHSSFLANYSDWHDACNISGNGWISGIVVSSEDVSNNRNEMDLKLAINVDGVDLTTTTNPLVIPANLIINGQAYSIGFMRSNICITPLVIHFDSSCRIQAQTTNNMSPDKAYISYWL